MAEEVKVKKEELPEMKQTDSKLSEGTGKQKIVLDTGAFIQCSDINAMGMKYDLVTTEGVLNEIRDRRAREKFLTLVVKIVAMNPHPDSKKAGNESSFLRLHLISR